VRFVSPVLIAMCGMPFSGKSVLAQSLGRELHIRVLSYDAEIYLPSRHLVPAGASLSAESGFIQGIARRRIAEILDTGTSLIYDDLLLEREDRRKLAAMAQQHRARLILVYLDTPLTTIEQRREQNSRTRARTSVPESVMDMDAVLLEPPDDSESPVRVAPGDVLPEILARIQARL
jgi:predicted kinase